MQNDTGSDEFGLALKQFWGNVTDAFRDGSMLFSGEQNVIARKNISGTNSAQFLMLADTPAAEDHIPGEQLMGQPYAVGDGTISTDGFVVAHHDVPKDQILTSHFNIVNPLAVKMGKQLARDYDQKLFNLGINTARMPAVTHTATGLNIHNGGNRVRRAVADLVTAYPVTTAGATNFRDDVALLGQLMDEDNVPDDERYLLVTPYIWRVMGKDTSIFNSDFNRDPKNNMNNRQIVELEGFKVQKAINRIPSTNVTGYSRSKYNGNYLNTGVGLGQPAALALCGASEASAAIGVVTLQHIIPEMQDDIRRSTLFMKASILMGAGSLHPWCAGSIEVGNQ